MEKNIIALLNKNLRVIIPDFGAFIIRQKQPRIIVFNEFLRYNDGLLIDFIIKTEGIDREIAEQRVFDFADEGTRILDAGKELVLEGLGTLHKEASGKINFVETGDSEEIPEKIIEEPEKPGVQELSQKPSEVSPPVIGVAKTKARRSTKGKAKVIPENEPAVEPLPVEAMPSKEPVEVSPQAEITEPVEASALLAESAGPIEPPSPPVEDTGPIEPPSPPVEDTGLIEPPSPPVVKEYTPPEATEETPEPVSPEREEQSYLEEPSFLSRLFANNRTNQVLGWILLILVVNAVILAWFVFKDEIQGLFRKKAAPVVMITDSVYQRLADSVKAAAVDTSLVYMETANEPVKIASKPQPSSSRFYIVAGCFRDEANAQALVTSLKKLGYKAENFGKIGNLYAVCFASFDDKDKAVQELKRIREKVPDAWMTRF
jgi:nucleoid DNA-binding protein